ncbi:dehydrogenase [Rhizobium nepotum]|uniref:dehydrogenase n=1 Tax=Rhizobium nepotum TaxID=1035271 RepID=UPI003CEDF0BC
MKLSKILMLAALPLALAACSVSTKSVSPVKPPSIARADSALLKACDLPVDIGNKPLLQERVEDLWSTDRTSLLACYRRHLALRNFVVDRDDALRDDLAGVKP